MKKPALLLLALPLMALSFTACNDSDDDIPEVTVKFEYSGGVVSENQVYVVQPDSLSIDNIEVTALRPGHKAMCVGPVHYYIDGVPVLSNYVPPYDIGIDSSQLSVGSYLLTAHMGILEDGYPMFQAVVSVRINVVADASDIPIPATGTRTTQQVDYLIE